MGFDPSLGSEGRVRVLVNGFFREPFAGVSEWRLTKSVAVVPFNHFEIPGDSAQQLWEDFLPSLASATVTLRGHFNTYEDEEADYSTEAGVFGLTVGSSVVLDLLFTRDPFGYTDLAGSVVQFETGTGVENQTGTFSATVRLRGTVPAAAAA